MNRYVNYLFLLLKQKKKDINTVMETIINNFKTYFY